MRPTSRAIPLLRTSAVALALLALAACKTTGDADVTGSIGGAAGPRTETEWRRAVEVYGTRYQENRNDAETAIRYAEALRQTTQRAQAVAVLEQASIANPYYKPLLGAYGRALAEVGRYEQALEVLSRAHTPDQPDWRILNVQGAVLDQLGRHDEARRHSVSVRGPAAPPIEPVTSSLVVLQAASARSASATALVRSNGIVRDVGRNVRHIGGFPPAGRPLRNNWLTLTVR